MMQRLLSLQRCSYCHLLVLILCIGSLIPYCQSFQSIIRSPVVTPTNIVRLLEKSKQQHQMSRGSSTTTRIFSSIIEGDVDVTITEKDSVSTTSPLPPPSVPEQTTTEYFNFKGYDIYTQVTKTENNKDGKKKPTHIILLHGFGCSTVYWRETINALMNANNDDREHIIHALDFLGQGKSSKPGRKDGIEYSINLWAELVDTYARETISDNKNSDIEIILMGNSLGSTVALAAATGDYHYDDTWRTSSIKEDSGSDNDTTTSTTTTTEPFIRNYIKGICMFNCGIGMNSYNVIKEEQWTPIQRTLLKFVFDTVNTLIYGNIPLLTYVLDKVVTKELLQNTLTSLYKYSNDVDTRINDELVNSFYEPAKDIGSPDVLSQIYTNDPGKTPFELFEQYNDLLLSSKLPIHFVWGDDDPIVPVSGGLGTYYTKLANDPSIPNISLDMVSAGHIPFDEVPIESHQSMNQWLTKNVYSK